MLKYHTGFLKMGSNWSSTNPSEYEGEILKETEVLKTYLQWCLDLLDEFPMEPSHGGPCSPPATNCDGACADAYYFYETLEKIRNLIN